MSAASLTAVPPVAARPRARGTRRPGAGVPVLLAAAAAVVALVALSAGANGACTGIGMTASTIELPGASATL